MSLAPYFESSANNTQINQVAKQLEPLTLCLRRRTAVCYHGNDACVLRYIVACVMLRAAEICSLLIFSKLKSAFISD